VDPSLPERFLQVVTELYPDAASDSIRNVLSQDAKPVEPTVIRNQQAGAGELAEIASALDYPGVAYFIFACTDFSKSTQHPLADLASQLSRVADIGGVMRPANQGSRSSDGIDKIFDASKSPENLGWSKARTSGDFGSHNDGLTQEGRVRTVGMMLDSPPLWGGFTYFQNVVRISLALANDDREAFDALFAPDALTAWRSNTSGHQCVSSPVLFLNNSGRPQCFYRNPAGEYHVKWREDLPALMRARNYLRRCTLPFGAASLFVHLTRRGEGVFVQNERVVHGRTRFINDGSINRVLTRMWFGIG
jgi:hypothetical protein